MTLKTVFTVCFGVFGVYALVMFVARTGIALTLTLSAVLIAVALHHGVDFLVRHRISRRPAIAVVVFAGLGLVVGLALLVVPPAIEQGKSFIQEFPNFLRNTRSSALFHTLDGRMHLGQRLDDLERRLPNLIEGAVAPLISVVGGVVSAVAATITIVVIAAFMLIFGPALIRATLNEALPEHHQVYRKVLFKIYASIGGYLGGLMLICTVNATLTAAFLALIGVPFFVPLAIIGGSSSLIPYAGTAVAGTLISIIATVTVGAWKGLACAIFFLLYGQLEGNVLAPLIFRRTVHVNPLVVTLSILFLGELAGIFGAILAVPAAAAIQIVLREVLRERRERLHLPLAPDSGVLSTPVSSARTQP